MRGCQFTREQLYSFARQYARMYWNREFDIEIELLNREWKNRMACYTVYKDGRKVIRMSKVNNARMVDEAVLGTLKHELVHWHLHTSGKPYSDESDEFIAECMRIGAPMSQAESAQKAFGDYITKNLYAYFDTIRKQENK